jgi:hypothetical protein
MRGALDGLGDRAASGARHHARRINPRRNQPVQHHHALIGRQRIGLAVGAEHRQPADLRQQPAAVRDQALGIGAEIGFERGDDGRQYALNAICHAHVDSEIVEG